MKMTKKAFQFLCLGLALILSNALYAQSGEGQQGRGQKEPTTAEQRPQKMTDRQKAELGLGSGKIKRKHAFKRHILTKKSTKRKARLTKDGLVHKADMKSVKEQLLM